jgi:hypothetical protein
MLPLFIIIFNMYISFGLLLNHKGAYALPTVQNDSHHPVLFARFLLSEIHKLFTDVLSNHFAVSAEIS